MINLKDKVFDVLIIGGGYSGQIAAINGARLGLSVCLVEKNKLLGKKILSTGNGRCNFTNSKMDSSYFYSESDLSNLNLNYNDSIIFLNSIGVIETDNNNYFYPITNQAKTIRDALENAISKLENITTVIDVEITNIEFNKLYLSTYYAGKIKSRNVIIATGGKAAPSIGGSDWGYKFASQFNIPITNLYPALVGLKSTDNKLQKLAGVRCLGKVSYKSFSCEGEIQFNKDGISGYPVMCISREISKDLTNGPVNISIDFIPYLSKELLNEEFAKRLENDSNPLNAFIGLLNDKCIEVCLDNINDTYYISAFKNVTFSIESTKGYDSAQVTAGGVSLNALDLKTMMVTNPKYEGLYFIGEVVDIDGICGGYNLQWALTSALLATNNISSRNNQ